MLCNRIPLLVLLFSLLVCGCGIKPHDLSAPEDSENTAYPRTYPDPANDPAGTKRF